jgi:uncharacterized membrane protein
MIGLLPVLALILAIVALRRTRADGPLDARLEALERRLQALEAALASRREPQSAKEPEEASVPPRTVREPEPAPPPEPLEPAADVEPEAELPPGPPPIPPPPRQIDWERLFGVRAAAVLGGVALALAGILFFKYSIEHGLVSPWLRVVIGTVAGVGCIVGSEWTLRREYPGSANALAGAGVVVLYAAFWAAGALYGLVQVQTGFVLMAVVTAACCGLSWRHSSLVVALLGLVGGFATPLLLSSGADRPLGLFGYVLLLDIALLALAHQKRWPHLGALSLAGTILYEALWIAFRMGPERLGLALGILALFAFVFAVAGSLARSDDDSAWLPTQAAGVLMPFAFAFYLATVARFDAHLSPLASLLVLLSAAAGWIGETRESHRLGLGAAAAGVAVMTVWTLTHAVFGRLAWETALWSGLLAAVFHVFVERAPDRSDREGPAPAAMLSSVGLFALLLIGAVRGAGLWPWVTGWAVLAGLLLRHGGFSARGRLQLVAALGMALGLAALARAHGHRPDFLTPAEYLGLLLAASLALQGAALVRRLPEAARAAEHAAALLPALLVLSLTDPHVLTAEPAVVVFLGGTLALGFLVALAATRLGSGYWLLVATGVTALAQLGWTAATHVGPDQHALALGALALAFAAVLLFTAWPFLAPARFRDQAAAWAAAALAAPAWFLTLKQLWHVRFGDGAIGLLAVALGAVSLAAALRAREVWPAGAPARTAALAWLSAAALGFACVAVPLQLEKEWITIGWALEGLAVLVLWTRLDHPGLKYFGLALLAAVTVRLIANPAILGYYPRPTWRIVNWLLYTYLVPAAALLASSAVLGPRELARLRRFEREPYYLEQPLGALACGLAGLVVIFVWVNLAIADWFATGPTLVVTFERLPARDLTTSIAWAVYALGLLAAGMARRSIGLRWVSLGLLLITIAKVFLYDLGELRDLYRVASLLGLAISLMLVSIAYQRFVFRSASAERS